MSVVATRIIDEDGDAFVVNVGGKDDTSIGDRSGLDGDRIYLSPDKARRMAAFLETAAGMVEADE